MATLERLIRHVKASFGPGKRIWLTEYGYQTNPPDRILGVSRALQARYVGEAARRVFTAPNVDMLIHYLYRDEPGIGRWQSGLITAGGSAKPARRAYMVAVAHAYRRGRTTAICDAQLRALGGADVAVEEAALRRAIDAVHGQPAAVPELLEHVELPAGAGADVRLHTPSRTVSPILVVR